MTLLYLIIFTDTFLKPASNIASFVTATYWIQRCWLSSKASIHHNGQILESEELKSPKYSMNDVPHKTSPEATDDPERAQQCTLLLTEFTSNPVHGCDNSQSKKATVKVGIASPMSPRRRRAMERESMIEKVRHMVSSPFPYMVLILLLIMIVMIFIDIMPIAGMKWNRI
jgi:hypothetical protein